MPWNDFLILELNFLFNSNLIEQERLYDPFRYLVLSKVALLSLLNNQLAGGQRPSLSDGDDLMVVSIPGQLLALKGKQSIQVQVQTEIKYHDFS